MINYQTFKEIHFLSEQKHLSIAGIACRLKLDTHTVSKWLAQDKYTPRKSPPRASILDPYKSMIRRDWELGGSTLKEIMSHLRAAGYTGGVTILNTYLSGIRRIENSDFEQYLPFEWMLRILQGKLKLDFILSDCHNLSRDDAVFTLLHSPPKDHGVNRTSWRMDDLKLVLKNQGVIINKDSIRLIIKNAGYRFRSAKKVLTSTDPAYKEKLEEVTRVLSTLTESQKFFSIDEFGPFAVKIQGGRALTGPDQLRIVPQWQKSKGSLTFVGALELSTNQITHFYSDKKNTAEMIKLMHLLLREYQDQSLLYLSWDAASWHASKAFLQEVARVNGAEYREVNQFPSIALVPLPASAQFLNVIESVFSGMARAIIHNSNYDSVEDCKESINSYLDERNNFFKAHPKRAGKKIWGKEPCLSVFSTSNNCKDSNFR